MLASIVVYATEDRQDTGSYRIPIAIQFAWAIILAGGLFTLPDSPRYFVKKGRLEDASISLSRLRGQPRDSEYVQVELAEIVANVSCPGVPHYSTFCTDVKTGRVRAKRHSRQWLVFQLGELLQR